MRLPGRRSPLDSAQDAADGDDPRTVVCMPLLRNSVALWPAGCLKSWRNVGPGEAAPRKVDVRDGTLTCRLPGAELVTAKVMPARIANDDLTGVADTSELWPDAAAELETY